MVPAAALIPDPIAYIKVVTVKRIVVGILVGAIGPTLCVGFLSSTAILDDSLSGKKSLGRGYQSFTMKKL